MKITFLVVGKTVGKNLTEMIEDKAIPASLESSLHKTIKKVSSDIENMKFNTAIATLMAFINEIYAVGFVTKEVLGAFVSLLSPFAPHIAEEIWEMMGNTEMLSVSPWPTYDEAKTIDQTIEIPVQINGKTKAVLNIAIDESKESILERAKEVLGAKITGTIVKEIYVPKKIVNIVQK